MNKKEEELEKLYKEIEAELPEDSPPEPVDSISQFNCTQCGNRLSTTEYQDFEDTCEECVFADTSGLVDDTGGELEFDE